MTKTRWGDDVPLTSDGSATLGDRVAWLKECAAAIPIRQSHADAAEVAEALRYYEGEVTRLGKDAPDVAGDPALARSQAASGRAPVSKQSAADSWADSIAKTNARLGIPTK